MTVHLIVISILLLTITFQFYKLKKMAQEVTDLKTAADAIVAQNAQLKAQVATLTTEVANSIQPSDITPITQELNDAVAAP